MKRTLYDEVYKVTVDFYWNLSANELKKKLGKKGELDNPDFYDSKQGALCTIDEKQKDGGILRKYVVWVSKKKDFYTLMHECIHLVSNVFNDCGIAYRPENDEPIAYYHSFWFKKLWRTMNK